MKKKKAFTLIELLAVIIILGIVALIATPIVLNVVENAQKKAFERSAQGYYDAARYVHNDMMLNNEEKETKFTFEDGIQKSDNPNYILEIQGETPKSGTVHLSKDGQILVAIANDKWCATTTGNGVVDLSEDIDLCGYAPEECLIYNDSSFSDSLSTVDFKTQVKNQNLSFDGMDDTLLAVSGFDSENPSCKGIVIIPEEHDGKKVEKVEHRVFADNTNITSVILPKELKLIGWYAFDGASNLKQVVMNDELRAIGDYSFRNTALTEITIPSKVGYLGKRSFYETKMLNKATILNPLAQTTTYGNYLSSTNPILSSSVKEVEFGPNVQKIPSLFLYGNKSLEKVTMSEGVTSIGSYAFSYAVKGTTSYSKLSSINIPNTVTTIGSYAFKNTSLTSITIPSSVTNIGSNAFQHSKLTSLEIPDTVKSIGSSAFASNQINDLTIGTALDISSANVFTSNPLTTLTISEGATTIKDNMFKDHETVNLTLPSTLTSIGLNAFQNNQITNVTIPSGVENVPDYAFNNNKLESINIEGVKTIGKSSFDTNELTRVDIPEGVTSIGACAFCNNHLTDYTLPNTLVTLDPTAFNNNSITGDKAFIYARNTNGTEDRTKIIGYVGPNGVAITIPEGVTTILGNVFNGKGLTGVTLPSTLTNIGIAAFSNNQLPDNQAFIYARNSDGSEDKTTIVSYGGAKRDNVVIPSGVTTIGDAAFENCQIMNVDIPDSVTNIGANSFRNNQLVRLDIPNSVTSIGTHAFSFNKINNLTIGLALSGIEYNCLYMFQGNPLTTLTIKEGVTNIRNNEFKDYSIVNLILPSTLKFIGSNAFSGNQITNLNIPNSVTTIGSQAFNNNQLPDNQAFIYARNNDGSEDKTTIVSYGGAKRDNVVIPSGVTTIGDAAFETLGCTSITIPEGVVTIGQSAFAYNKLGEITIPSSLEDIRTGAFQWNSFANASSITILGDDPNRFDSTWTSIGFPAK